MWFNLVLGIIGLVGFVFMLAVFAATLITGKTKQPTQKPPTIFTMSIDSTKTAQNSKTKWQEY